MCSRYLILLAMLVFPELISYGQFDSLLSPKQLSVDPELVIQVGAFHQDFYASTLQKKLSTLIDKSVIIVNEDGFYKVRITGFSGYEEMEKFYPTLAFLGMKDFWVLPVKKQEEILNQNDVKPDTAKKPADEAKNLPVVAEEIPAGTQANVVLQVDVFRNKSEALNAQKKITTKLNLHVEIVQEWDYYKVFVTGFNTTDEAKKYFSAIANLGYPKISLIDNYKK
jgi:cell division protein FtsN